VPTETNPELFKAIASIEPHSLSAVAFCRYTTCVLKVFVQEEVWVRRLEPILGRNSLEHVQLLERENAEQAAHDRESIVLETLKAPIDDACKLFEQAIELLEAVAKILQPGRQSLWSSAFRLEAQTFLTTHTSRLAMRKVMQSLFRWVLWQNGGPAAPPEESASRFMNTDQEEIGGSNASCAKRSEPTRNCQTVLAQLDEDMLILGVFDLWRDLISIQICEAIEEQVNRLALGELCRSVIDRLLAWVNRLIQPWLQSMQLDRSAWRPSLASGLWYDEVSSWEKKMLYFTHEALLHARLQELFDIIVEFPASRPALVDIRECLERTDALQEMTQSLCMQLERRLLHAGASTSDILHHFVNTIQSLLLVEPHGFLLSRASELLHRYLMTNRPEAMTCLVELFTSPEGRSLFPLDVDPSMGLAKSSKRPHRGEVAVEPDDVEEDLSDSDWEPDSINAPLTGNASEARGQMARNFARFDMLFILMNACGGRGRFVAEYHRYLAEQLTRFMDHDFEQLLRNLEILKIRLGPGCLSNAEIMLKDVSDSRRFSNILRSQSSFSSNTETAVELLTISYLYWPCVVPAHDLDKPGARSLRISAGPNLIGADYFAVQKRHQYRLVPFIEQFFRTSQECFARQKAPRVLHWIPELGVCDVELDFDDGRRLEMRNVLLIDAMLIDLFAKRPRMTRTELSRELFGTLQAPEHEGVHENCEPLRSSMMDRALRFWIRHNVLRLVGNDSYEVIECAADDMPFHSGELEVDATQADPIADALSAASKATDTIEASNDDEDQRIFENYILGMLANFESLSLERIHQMLSMFCTDPPFRGTVADVAACLGRLLDAGQIRYEHGQYHRKT
jgi:anaphase-promoting complex subunit 2